MYRFLNFSGKILCSTQVRPVSRKGDTLKLNGVKCGFIGCTVDDV